MSVRSFMKEVVDHRLAGNISSLARGLGISPVQARQYALGQYLPQIQDWASISEIAGGSLLDLLPHRPLPRDLGDHPWFVESTRLLTRKVHPKENLTAITARTVLRGALNAQVAVSLTQLAASVGTKYHRLQRLAPGLAADVSKRYRLSVGANARAKHVKFRKDLSRAVDNILLTGKFPTTTLVAAHIGVEVGWPGFYRDVYLAELQKRKLVNSSGRRNGKVAGAP